MAENLKNDQLKFNSLGLIKYIICVDLIGEHFEFMDYKHITYNI